MRVQRAADVPFGGPPTLTPTIGVNAGIALPVVVPGLVATMPVRIPIDLGGGDANLLLPLYAVIAGGLAATVWDAWREPAAAPAVRDDRGGWLEAIGWVLAGVVVLYAIQAAYADDLSPALPVGSASGTV